jgi:hypothetical protein
VQHDLESLPPAYLATHWMYSEAHLQQEEDKEKAAERMLQAVCSKLPPSVKPEARMTRGPPMSPYCTWLGVPADFSRHGNSGGARWSMCRSPVAQVPCPVLTVKDLGRRLWSLI